MQLAFLLVNLVHLKCLINSYVDVQLARQDLIVRQMESQPPNHHGAPSRMSHFKLIGVQKPNNTGVVYSKIDPDDYDRIMELSQTWKLSPSGYAFVCKRVGENKQQTKTIYLHREIYGTQARHINGDRLDNRRCNLVLSTRKLARPPTVAEEFVLHQVRMMTTSCCTYDEDDPVLPQVNGYAIIKMANQKIYSGEVLAGKPRGYGMISVNGDSPYDMTGLWENGHLMNGIITYYKPLPQVWEPMPRVLTTREIVSIEVVSRGTKC